MLKSLPLTFVQQALEQTLLEEHIKNDHYFGGRNQISLVSFYEQLKTQNEIDRFVETVRDLNDQQNRTGLIGNGVLLTQENPTITNLYSSTIIPFTWTCSIRTTLGNRDAMVETLQNLIEKLKGRKCDIAQLECEDFKGKQVPSLFKVGTLGQNEGQPAIKCGDYIGDVGYNQVLTTRINQLITNLVSKGFANNLQLGDYLYYTHNGAYGTTKYLSVATYEKRTKKYKPEATIVSSSGSYQVIDGINWYVYQITLEYEDLDVEGVIDYFDVVIDGYYERSPLSNINFSNSKLDITSITTSGTTTTVVAGFKTPQLGINSVVIDSLATEYSITLTQWYDVEDDGDYSHIVFPPQQTGAIYDKFKLSLSFDSFRIDEPHNLNGNEYCEISFGGSATLCNENVYLGNDLVKVSVQKNKILAETPIEFSGAITYYLEPLEMPSGLNANTQISQLISNNFKQNTHTDGTAGVLQYSFIMDKSFDILKQWFDYARFGTYGITASDICPNLIYNVVEYWSSWGVVDKHTMLCKITESIDIENTESDVLTLGVNFQIQGANN